MSDAEREPIASDDEEAYERARLENIRQNQELLRNLGVEGGVSGSATRSGQQTPDPRPTETAAARRRRAQQAAATRKKKENAQPERIQPRRVSSRLLGIEADSEALKRKYEEEAEAERQLMEAAKKARHQDHDLKDLTGGDLDTDALESLSAALASAGSAFELSPSSAVTRYGLRGRAAEAKSSADDSEKRKELKQVLDAMTLRSTAKVVPKRVYSSIIHPTSDKDLVFVGDKEGAIGVWEPLAPRVKGAADEDEDEAVEDPIPEGQAWTLQAHGKSPVTCLRLDPISATSLYSASYDATIRCLDLPTGKSREIWAGEDDVLLSIFDILTPSTHPAAFVTPPSYATGDKSLWVADHRGGLIHIDLRERSSRRSTNSRRWQVCEKKIGAMSINPLASHCIAVASLDQHVRLFDTRSLTSLPAVQEAPHNYKGVDLSLLEKVEDKAQIAKSKARLACTSVDFSPAGEHLAAVSYDDVVKIWDVHPGWLQRAGPVGKPSAASTAKSRSPRKSAPSAKMASEPSKAPNGKPKSAAASSRGSSRRVKKEEADEDEVDKKDVKRPGLLRWFSRSSEDVKKGVKGGEEEEEEKGGEEAEAEDEDDQEDEPASVTASKALGSLPDFSDAPKAPADVLGSPVVMKHNNQTGKWLTLFRAKWCANPEAEAHFSIGSMSRAAEIVDANGKVLRSLFDEEYVTAVPAVTALHPVRLGRLATGNASGRCTFWAPPDE